MIPTSVTYTGHEVGDPALVLDTSPTNKPCFWPDDWTIIVEESEEEFGDLRMFAWARDNCEHRWDMEFDNLGRRIFAFESEDEAVLFRLSF